LAVLIVGGAASWFFFLSPSHSGSPFFDRHGLPSNVPLPNNVSFDSTQTSTGTTGQTTQWVWLVNGQHASDVDTFYQDNLPGKGWGSPRTFLVKDLFVSCQGTQILIYGASDKAGTVKDAQGNKRTVTPPAGGSLLELDLAQTTDQKTLAVICSSQTIPGIPTP
jgi:hypothetical protein